MGKLRGDQIDGIFKDNAFKVEDASTSNQADFETSALTGNKTFTLPDKSGTVALLSDTGLPAVLGVDSSTGGTDLSVLSGDKITSSATADLKIEPAADDANKLLLYGGADLTSGLDGGNVEVIGGLSTPGTSLLSGSVIVDAGTASPGLEGSVLIGTTNALTTAINTANKDQTLTMNTGTGVKTTTLGSTNTTSTTVINAGASGDLTLGARSGSVTLNQVGDTTLSGFTATSIVGALNELKSSPAAAALSTVLAAGNTTGATAIEIDNASGGIISTAGSGSAGIEIDITAGAGDGAFSGGALDFNGGVGGATGTGGAVTIDGGAGGSSSGTSGGVTVQSGSTTNGNTGNVTLRSSAATGTSRSTGTVTLSTGVPTGSGFGGTINITPGNVPGGGTGGGGALNLFSGNGGSTGTGGGLSLTAGNGSSPGIINITAGAAASFSGTGGSVNLISGEGGSSGTGGALTLSSGGVSGGTGNASGNATVQTTAVSNSAQTSGQLTLQTGNAGGGSTATSGELQLRSGHITLGASTGNSGSVNITSGTVSGSGNSGTIVISPGGVNGGTAGSIEIGSSTAALTLNLGTGGTNAKTINMGTAAVANVITIGSSSAASVNIDSDGASNFTVAGASADLTLGARGATVTLNEAGHTALVGFTATSIIRALNELNAGIPTTGMTSVVSEINTTDATQTSFGALFSPAVASVNLCNIRVVSVKQTTGDWATFQWLGAVLEDSDNDLVFEIHNGTTSTAPDNSQGGASAIRLAIGLSGGSSELEIKITAIAASNYRHRLVLEYSPLVYS